MQLRGQVLQQEGQPLVNRLGSEDVVIIQHQGELAATPVGHLADQHSQHRLGRGRLRGVHQCQGAPPQLGIHRLQGGNQIGEKASGIIVRRFQGEPGDRQRALSAPLR
jgi:hypothetical protein